MKLRPFIALLLVITLALATAASPVQSPEAETVDRGEEKLTAEEEREARLVAARFIKRWQETEDIGPLVDEFFIADFVERLRTEPETLYFAELKPELLVSENGDDLLKYYVAMTNSVRLIFRICQVYEATGPEEEGRDGPEWYETIPAGVWNVLRSNPIMAEVLAEEMGARDGATGEQDAARRAEAKTIKSIEELRSLTATLEQASLLLRDHLKTLPSTPPERETQREHEGQADANTAESDDDLNPRLTILGGDFFNYPAGTRLVYFHLLMFRVDLVRVGQHFKVLSVYIQSD
ncbi:MAG TPA: hypothetical protein VF544_07065 [Pyrinomonadaceae bacterium]|jgi:hypothetical protein